RCLVGGWLAPTHQGGLGAKNTMSYSVHTEQSGPRRVAALVAAVTLTIVVAGCASSEDAPRLHAERRSIGTLGSGFVDVAAPPAPESTIRPKPGSWEAVHPPRGYHVVLLTAGDDASTTTLVTGVKEWAKAEQITLETVTAKDPHLHVDAIVEAIELKPDLII